jgi:hypothetical protein
MILDILTPDNFGDRPAVQVLTSCDGADGFVRDKSVYPPGVRSRNLYDVLSPTGLPTNPRWLLEQLRFHSWIERLPVLTDDSEFLPEDSCHLNCHPEKPIFLLLVVRCERVLVDYDHVIIGLTARLDKVRQQPFNRFHEGFLSVAYFLI